MKRTILLLAAFLAATFAFGQGQDSIRAVSGVLTISIAPSKTYYKVFVDQTITSTVFTGQVPGTAVNVLFLQDSTGHTVAFGGNIGSGCTVASAASATTGCQFLFDSANNQWTAVGGGSGGAVLGGQTVTATQLATNAGQTLFMDTQEAGLNSCSVTGSPAVVTCTSNTFTCPGDTGKIIWAVNAATPGLLALGDSTITTCTDAKHVTASTNTVTSGAVSNLRWGHDDTAAWDAINTAYNTLLATQGTCLLLPAGMTTVKHGTLLINPTGAYSNNGPFPACFKSLGMTYFSPVPDFNFYFYNASGTNIQFLGLGVGNCCKVGTPEPSVAEGILIDGATLNSGTGTCNVSPSPQTGMFLSQAHTKKVGVNNWCTAVSGFAAIVLDNLGTHFDLESVGDGNTGPTVQGSNPWSPTNIIGGRMLCGIGQVFDANFSTSVNTENVAFQCAKQIIQFAPGSSTVVWHSSHDSFLQQGSATNVVFSVQTGTAWLTDCYAQSSTGNPILQTQGSGIVHFKGCTLNAASGQFWGDTHTVAGGVCYDDGGNLISAGGSFASDCIPTGSNGIWGVGTGVATANTTLFLVAPSATTTLFTNTTATTSSGVAPFTGTLANLVCTATAAGTNASSGAVTVRLAPLSTGTFAASTLTATFGQTTSAKDQTHTVAITQGQPIQFQVTTQAAETLAGVQCRVSEY